MRHTIIAMPSVVFNTSNLNEDTWAAPRHSSRRIEAQLIRQDVSADAS